MTVTVGVCQWSLDGAGPDVLVRARELGFDALHLDGGEISPDSWLPDGPATADAFGEAAARTGVTIVAVAPGRLNQLGLTSPLGSERALACERSIEVAIRAAARLSVPMVFLPSFVNGEIRDEGGLRRTAEAMQAACDVGAAEGLTIATENTLSAADNVRLLDIVDRPNARVMLDTQNVALWGHDGAAYVDALWPRLASQAHVKDGRDGVMGNAPLGEGEAGVGETLAALRAHGFDGDLISENDYSGEAAKTAARDLAVLGAMFATGA